METESLQPNSKDQEDESSREIDLDTVLVEEIGQMGRYQLKMVALSVVIVIFMSWASNEYVFSAARIPTRCFIPECENTTESPEFAPSWILGAVPSSARSLDSCHRFAPANISATDIGNSSCPAILFDNSSLVPCSEFVYENKDTVVYDYNLACDEWHRSLIGAARTLGTLTALPITGFVSDTWGRRTALAINGLNTACIGLARYWTTTYIGFLASEFLEATLGSGVYSSVYILLMEVIGPRYRVLAGALMSTAFATGQITLAALSWILPNWRQLYLVLYIPQFITLAYFWLMAESVRWYLSKGHYEKATKVLKDIANVNKKDLSEKSLEALRQSVGKRESKTLKDEEKDKEWLVSLVFRHKPILLRCVVSPVWWITCTFVYYGMSINAVNISGSGNKYTKYLAVSFFEIPGFWIAFASLSRFGRKPVFIAAFWTCAACLIGYTLTPDGHPGISLTLYLLGKCSIATCTTTLYLYTTELYPTQYRHSLFAFSSMMGRIGSIVAPLTPAFAGKLPFILFAGMAALSGLLVFLTPETLGCRLPDTMEEAADLGKKKIHTIVK